MSAAAIGTRIPTHSRSTVLGDSQASLLDCFSGDPIPLPDKNGCCRYLRWLTGALHGANPDWFAIHVKGCSRHAILRPGRLLGGLIVVVSGFSSFLFVTAVPVVK